MDLTRFIAYIGVDDRWIICREYVCSKPQTVFHILCLMQNVVTVRSLSRIQVGVIKPNTIIGIHSMGQVHEQILISDVFQRNLIMGIERNISTIASLMKMNLRNQNHADNFVMAASRKQMTHLLRINVI